MAQQRTSATYASVSQLLSTVGEVAGFERRAAAFTDQPALGADDTAAVATTPHHSD